MQICESMDIMDKLVILTDAAKYDVACTSSGTERKNNGKGIGNTARSGICHSFSAEDVYHSLRFLCPMNVYLTAGIVLTERVMTL